MGKLSKASPGAKNQFQIDVKMKSTERIIAKPVIELLAIVASFTIAQAQNHAPADVIYLNYDEELVVLYPLFLNYLE